MKPKTNNLRRFLSYVNPYRWTFVLSTLLGVVEFNLPVVFPWILKDLIDNIFAGKPSATGLSFNQIMLISMALFALYAVITYIRSYISFRLTHYLIFDIRKDLFQHLQELPINFYQKHQTGAITSRLITDVNNAQNLINVAGRNLLIDLTRLASITFVIFYMNWQLALIACSTLPLYLVLQRRIGERMREKAREARRRMDVVEGQLHEAVAGITEIKSFTHEAEETKRFEVRSRGFLDVVFENIRMYALLLGSTTLITRLTPVIVIWVGGHLILQEKLSIGSLMAFYAYLEMIYIPLNRLGEMSIEIANSRAAIDRLFEFFDFERESKNASSPPLILQRGKIAYQDVFFGYDPNNPLFQGINLHIPAGGCVALVGPSGAGKSTLIRLLIRFFDPWKGSITIDDQDISQVNLHSLRSNISVVQQDLMLFSGTVADNLKIGKADATPEEILRAAELANAREFIEGLPDGFQTEVGERGVKLSGGQRQLVAITRSFLKNAPILILDESTSNLDTPSERLIYDALQRLMTGRTTIIIAHRMSTVIQAETIFVLKSGEIVQQGHHDDLLQLKEGAYYRLYSNLFIAGVN
jgi:ABC-type multidrug transport system fused ATPase/permease subunit